MSPPDAPRPAAPNRREQTIQILCDEFAQDRLTLEDFEARLDQAHRAGSERELDALIADLRAPLPVPAAAAPVPAPSPPPPVVAVPIDRRESQTLVAVMGGVERRGRWTPAEQTQLIAVMGGGELDFREAQLAPGVTELNVFALMGGFEIIVPPGLAVDCNGVAIMGGFAHADHAPQQLSAEAPVLKINGFVMMGGVEITVRAPGESAKEAARRQREERKRLKKTNRRLEGGE